MPNIPIEIFRGKAQAKTDFIDSQIAKLEKLLDKLGLLLSDAVIKDFIEILDTKNGIILTNLQNQRKVNLLERIYQSFLETEGYKVVTMLVEDMYSLSGMNEDYFTQLAGMKVNTTSISKILNERLGLTETGILKQKGFMKSVLDDETVKNEIKNFAMEKLTGGTGFEDLKNGMKQLIAGDKEKMGAFKQFYRNVAYDTYAKVDALNGKLYADELNLNYFIYAGTRRKTSRYFCLHRKGQVFSRDEALDWKDLIGTFAIEKGKRVSAGPILSGEDAATYNPFVDRGGYGCVDDIMWISDDVAFELRTELMKI